MRYLFADMLDDVLEFFAQALFWVFGLICYILDSLMEKFVEELEDPKHYKVVEKFLLFPKELHDDKRFFSKQKILKQLYSVKLKNGKRLKFWISLDWVECEYTCKKCMLKAICDGTKLVNEETYK